MNLLDKMVMFGLVICVGTIVQNDLVNQLYPNSPKGFWRDLLGSHSTRGTK